MGIFIYYLVVNICMVNTMNSKAKKAGKGFLYGLASGLDIMTTGVEYAGYPILYDVALKDKSRSEERYSGKNNFTSKKTIAGYALSKVEPIDNPKSDDAEGASFIAGNIAGVLINVATLAVPMISLAIADSAYNSYLQGKKAWNERKERKYSRVAASG